MELHLRERLRTVDLSGDLADRRTCGEEKPTYLKGSWGRVPMLEGCGVHDDARRKCRRDPTLVCREICFKRECNEADHFAGCCRMCVDPGEGPRCLVRNVVINQDAWRCCRERIDEVTDTAGTLRIGAINEHDRIWSPIWRLERNLTNGWNNVIDRRWGVSTNHCDLCAALAEDCLQPECCTERISIGSFVRHNPQPFCRTECLQHVGGNSGERRSSKCICALQVLRGVHRPLLAHPFTLRLFSSTPVRVGAGSGESVSGGRPPSAMLPSSC